MKKTFGLVLSALSLSLLVVSCSKDNVREENQQIADEIAGIVRTGTWRITTLKDDGVDRLSLVSGYTFTFDNNNKLIAVEGANTHEGTWSITVDNDDRNDLDFNIFFSDPIGLRELNEDWDILSHTATRITLSDDDDNPDEDMLIFEKL